LSTPVSRQTDTAAGEVLGTVSG